MRNKLHNLIVPAALLLTPGCAVWDAMVQGDLRQLTAQSAPDQVTAGTSEGDQTASSAHMSGHMSGDSRFATLGSNAALFEDDNEPAADAAYLVEAETLLQQLETDSDLSPEQGERLLNARDLIAAKSGRDAFRILASLASERSAQKMTYTLLQNDSLQKMTRQADIYANPWLWSQALSDDDVVSAARVAQLEADAN